MSDPLADLAALRSKSSPLDDLAALRTPDARTAIAQRAANPPAAAKGDPRATPETTLETYAPFAAHPIESGKGFISTVAGGIASLAHPLDAAAADADARDQALHRMLQRGLKSDDPEMLRDAVIYALPFIGNAFASVGKQMNSPNAKERARGFGGATALVAGPEMVKDATNLAVPTVDAAVTSYQKVIDPTLNNPLSRKVAERMIDEKTVLTDPKTQLAKIAQDRADAATKRVDAAVANMPNPVDRNAVLANIEKEKAQFINQVPGPNPNVTSAEPNGPTSQAVLDNINTYANNVRENASGGAITPANARTLRQNYDVIYNKNNPTATPADQARSVVGNAIRNELNKDPNVAAANADVHTELGVKKMAQQLPDTEPLNLGKKVGLLGIDALTSGIPGIGMLRAAIGAATVGKIAADVARSPAWRTWSAVQRAQFAKFVQASDLPNVAKMVEQAGVLSSGDNKH